MTQLFNLIDIIYYDKGKKIGQKEYFMEYFICQGLWKFSSLVVFIKKKRISTIIC
jgi:hypothetical protein